MNIEGKNIQGNENRFDGICLKCFKYLPENVLFCPHCGHLNPPIVPIRNKQLEELPEDVEEGKPLQKKQNGRSNGELFWVYALLIALAFVAVVIGSKIQSVYILGILGVGLLIFVLTKKVFWDIALFFGGLASLFAMIASIIWFQILAALGFFVLMVICFRVRSAIRDA